MSAGLVCSKCKAHHEATVLLDCVTVGFKCACGHAVDAIKVRHLLTQLINEQRVTQAAAALRGALDRGIACPCCGQFAKRYRRRFSAIMARWLIAFARASGGDRTKWVHVRDGGRIMGGASSASRSGDYAKIRWWGLLEPASKDEAAEVEGDDDNGAPSSGLWRLTPAGWDFVGATSTVPEFAVVYNNAVEGLDGDQITIQQSLGTKFDYDALMGRADPVPVTAAEPAQ